MRILNAECKGYSSKARTELRKIGEVIEVDADREQLLQLIHDVDILIVRLGNVIDREVLEKAKKLKVVMTATTGIDHIDYDEAKERSITVLSLKGETEFLQSITSTAELTWGLILSLVRRIPSAHEHVIGGQWQRDIFKGMELKNKLLGVVGYGRLGKMVAEYGKAFKMTVLAADPHVQNAPDWVQLLPLHELLISADIVTLHVGLTSQTKSFFKAEEFSYMKKGAFFINTSRGELIDENALLEALRSEKLAGAALDVLEGEVLRRKDWLLSHPLRKYAETNENLILTPHIGGATFDSMEDTEFFMVKKLQKFLENKGNGFYR